MLEKNQSLTLKIHKVRTCYTWEFEYSGEMLFLYCKPVWGLLFTFVWQRWRKFFFLKGKGAPSPTPYAKRKYFSKGFRRQCWLSNMSQDLPRCFSLIAWQLKQGLYHPSCMYVPANPLAKGSLSAGGAWCPPDKGLCRRRGAQGWARVLSACRAPSPPGLKAELLCPDISKQAETVWAAGSWSTNTLSNNDKSLVFLPRFTKEQWLTQNYTVTANYPTLIVILVSSTISFLQQFI